MGGPPRAASVFCKEMPLWNGSSHAPFVQPPPPSQNEGLCCVEGSCRRRDPSSEPRSTSKDISACVEGACPAGQPILESTDFVLPS